MDEHPYTFLIYQSIKVLFLVLVACYMLSFAATRVGYFDGNMQVVFHFLHLPTLIVTLMFILFSLLRYFEQYTKQLFPVRLGLGILGVSFLFLLLYLYFGGIHG